MLLFFAAVVLVCAVSVADAAGKTGITIDPKNEKQVMHSFGASDAWTCQFVGKNWPLAKRERIADLLFSMETDSKGNPKGIGLSMWRFYVGAGSAEQGEDSRINSPWHRAECFQKPDGSYDWSKQQGEQWFLRAAKARGVRYLLGFSCSPPVQYTANGIAHSDGGRSLSIRKGDMPKFAGFLADVAAHFGDANLPIDYISPINEPQWDWSSTKQEGTPATNADIRELTGLLGRELHARKLTTKVAVGEAGNPYHLIAQCGDNPATDQVKELWGKSPTAGPEHPEPVEGSKGASLAGIPNVAHMLSGHSYGSTWRIANQISAREDLRKRILEIDPKLAYWQTEFCILEQNDEIVSGPRRDLGMDTALYVARVIHSDLTIANASHWAWWLAVTQSDYKDGLVYLVPNDANEPNPQQTLQRDGQVLPSKLLWALGNFSRFVRPGMVRVNVTYDDGRSLLDAATSVMASAYLDKKTKQIVIVLINVTKEQQAIKLNGLAIRDNTFATYTTSESSDLAKGSTRADAISLPPRSVVTLVGRSDEP